MNSHIDWEILIPRTLALKLTQYGNIKCENVSVKAWDGPAVRLSRMPDLESVNLVRTSKKENPPSTSDFQLSGANPREKTRWRRRLVRLKRRSISRKATRSATKATSRKKSRALAK